MKIAIIGAGAAGLVTLKYGIEEGHECDAYEQTNYVGGLWVYHDEIVDANGLPISPMYKNLCTNLPKETMSFLDFPYPKMEKSFIHQPLVLDYLQNFAHNFNLPRCIKFHTTVTQVKPLPDNKWCVTSQNTETGEIKTMTYDAVFVCNGHFKVPSYPEVIPGEETFKGTKLHSIYFRTPDKYLNKRVLVVGGSASAVDIAQIVLSVAASVFVSCRCETLFKFSEHCVKKPPLLYFKETSIVFEDQSEEEIDAVIYCTGYKYDCPFLSQECGVTIDNNWVKPLYKHVVNIQNPTMFFIGLPQGLCTIPMFDIQARFGLASLNKFHLPPGDVMKKELEDYVYQLQKNDISLAHMHRMLSANLQEVYFNDLANTAQIRPIPTVVSKIYERVKCNKDPSLCFTIIDEENFTVHTCKA